MSTAAAPSRDLDVERDSDVPISTQIYWQLAYQIDSGRLQPGERLLPVRELGAALRVNPNTIRAVYRRLADAGLVTSRHGAGTVVADRPPKRRRPDELAAIVSELLRRGAQAGFSPDEVASATYAAATERKRPGDLVRVLFAECTSADAGYDAERLNAEFAGRIEAAGTLLDEIPERLDRFHFDLVATTTFHADEAQALVGGRAPVVAMLVGPGYVELVHEISALPTGSRIGVVCATERGAENIAETLQIAGATGIEIEAAIMGDDARLQVVNDTSDVILMSREAVNAGYTDRLDRPERVRLWAYDFDPAGLEILRRAIDHAAAERATPPEEPAVADGVRRPRVVAAARGTRAG
ncbi:MAG TPA: GntR family transcriptional regulator [Candidatus Limnocylindrales bacterium]|jgi:DNA-binding transcriptional regulator YhcF (GntR family)